jgi:perosamine synthetase
MIPLSVPNLSGNEWQYVKDCLDTNWVSSVGSYVNKFEEVTAKFTGAKYAIATSNGTAALHISLLLAGVQPGDLVIAPNLTFVASINAIKYAGANPILIDIDSESWQVDLDLLENFLSKETTVQEGYTILKSTNQRIKAMMPVHVLGNMTDMVSLSSIAERYHLIIVEDSTEALGSSQNDQHAGTFGLLGTISYNGNKLITTGGGGMIITSDEHLAKQAKHLTTTAKTTPDEYFHDEVGYNYRLVNILAAMGVAQMEQLPAFLNRKKEITEFYIDTLSKIEGIKFQKVRYDVQPNNWLFTAKFPNAKELLKSLNESGIMARPFWIPMNRLPATKNDLYISGSDNSYEVYSSCISLPCSTSITDEELSNVIAHIIRFYEA